MASNITPKSPIKQSPMRPAGSSLVAATEALRTDELVPAIALAIIPWVFVLLQLLAWILSFSAPVNLLLVTIVASTWSVIGFREAQKLKKRLKAFELGLEGELTVAEILDPVREAGYRVFHSVPGKEFDVDHVVVGRGGVFVIETKTWSKPNTGPCEIRYDGRYLFKNGSPVGRKPVDQVLRNTQWILGELEGRSRKKFPARSILTFPGWFVKSDARRDDVWVLNHKVVPSFILGERDAMSEEDVHLAVTHLEQFIRDARPGQFDNG